MSRRTLQVIACVVVAVGLCAVPFWGAEPLDWSRLFDRESADHRIFFELRLPRAVLVVLVGGFLSMLGGAYQVLFRNALAEPYVLGVSSAVTLGLVLCEAFLGMPAGTGVSVLVGMAAAVAVSLLIAAIALASRGQESERIVLFGMGINFVLSSLVFLILSYRQQQMGGGSFRWLFGQIPWAGYREVGLFAGLGGFLAMGLLLYGRHLDALALGDSVARTLGVSASRSRVGILVVTCLLTALTVSLVGSIGFVGLIVPNTVRYLFRPGSSRALLAWSFFFGGAFLLLSDGISRGIFPPFEFPIGIVTTLLGGPLFLVFLWKR